MKVIGLSEYGGPEVLRPFELPDPRPGTQEVLVRVLAAGVNPVDAMLRSGQLRQMYQGKTPPFVPGMEVAGTIEEVGSGVNPRRAWWPVLTSSGSWTIWAAAAVTANISPFPHDQWSWPPPARPAPRRPAF
ncbi:hypothetical protein SVIOM74S_09543 [Streptomyces violarus]